MTVDALRLVSFGTHRCTMSPMYRVDDWRLFLVLAVSLIAAGFFRSAWGTRFSSLRTDRPDRRCPLAGGDDRSSRRAFVGYKSARLYTSTSQLDENKSLPARTRAWAHALRQTFGIGFLWLPWSIRLGGSAVAVSTRRAHGAAKICNFYNRARRSCSNPLGYVSFPLL